MLARSRPEEFKELQQLAQADAEERWRFYEQLAGVERHAPGHLEENGQEGAPVAAEEVGA